MAPPLVLYSTNSWLAYMVAQTYFNREHYVWCTPYFGTYAMPTLDAAIPPSSSPAEIYRGLRQDVARRERHSDKIKANRAGILRGAGEKLTQNVISTAQAEEISAIVEGAEVADFAPLIYVIPYHLVSDRLVPVPISQRAHPLSMEFIIARLPRDHFDVLKIEGD